MSKMNSNLSKRLSMDIMILAIPVFVLSLGVFYLQSRRLIRHEAMKRANSAVQIALQHMDNYMNSIETSADANAWLLEENFTPDSIETISQRILKLNPYILSVSVSAEPDQFPQFGHLFSIYTVREDSIYSVRESDYDYTVKAWYKKAQSIGEASWVEPFSEYAEGTIDHNDAVATYCRPLRSATGKTIGVLSAEFSFNNLAKEIINTEHPYPNAYFVLLGADGRYFCHPDTTRLFRRTVFTNADPSENSDVIALGYEMTAGKQGVMHVKVKGQICHVSYSPVPNTDWSLAMVCPEDEVLEGYRRLGYVIAFLIVIGLFVMWRLCQKSVRQTIQPLNQLLDYTQHITEGNYHESIPLSEQDDDIGRIQNGFAAMQKALQKNMGIIYDAAEKLKKQNEQRSKEMKLAEEAVKRKTLFIQNLSHQIRTPLNIIVGFANVLHENIMLRNKSDETLKHFQPSNMKDIASTMKYNAFHLKRMVVMLYDSSSTTGDNELIDKRNDEVSCNEVARECIKYTESHFPEVKIKMETELTDEVRILTNHLYLMRCIRELLYNAAKYSDGEHITLRITEKTACFNFIVEDIGPGLPDNAEELINKPFNKIDELSEGLGVGLPLTKRHSMAMGGDLIYDNTYHDGCRFTIEMPK